MNDLIPTDRPCDLGPGKPNAALRPKLAALTVEQLFGGQPITDHNAARCCLSALWLLYDFLDESHTISQEIETVDGSYWHGIMHRREPDYFNSKYWFRRVGKHAIFPELLAQAKELIAAEKPIDDIAGEIARAKTWDPSRFVDWCEELAQGRAKQVKLAKQIAQAEWRLLFGFCFDRAVRK
jgi:hypothetical protein